MVLESSAPSLFRNSCLKVESRREVCRERRVVVGGLHETHVSPLYKRTSVVARTGLRALVARTTRERRDVIRAVAIERGRPR
jgi:hypothetical protein